MVPIKTPQVQHCLEGLVLFGKLMHAKASWPVGVVCMHKHISLAYIPWEVLVRHLHVPLCLDFDSPQARQAKPVRAHCMLTSCACPELMHCKGALRLRPHFQSSFAPSAGR